MTKKEKIKGGTFSQNKIEPIHRWYEYIEGYSSCLISNELNRIFAENPKIETVYDPFCGTGTTGLVASRMGLVPFYSESNPFMQTVVSTKLNTVKAFCQECHIHDLEQYVSIVQQMDIHHFDSWDGFEKFFVSEQLDVVLSIKALIQEEKNPIISELLMLALSAVIVRASRMIRRGDLRYATEKEYRHENAVDLFVDKLKQIIEDIEQFGSSISHGITKISEDARDNKEHDLFDCVITSPPYLNGTNYIRNTKLELKLNDFVRTEADLPMFHSKGIVAGINNVSKRSGSKPILPVVEPYFERLCESAYDKRIPEMVVAYFYDMSCVIDALHNSTRNNGYFVMDIGDSQFGGVHIPTHDILSAICIERGFLQTGEEILRERRSKNGMLLSQRLLRFRLEK